MNFKNDCYECIKLIKDAPYFPVDTGTLKNHATSMSPTSDGYVITFDGKIAPYVEYLEEGTRPHLILPKNGKYLVFKKNGKLIFTTEVHHPGSTKRKGFISNDSVNEIVNYFVNKYKGELR